ncbi:MAG: Flagellar hook protein FlgE [Pseudomonadota bacterium]
MSIASALTTAVSGLKAQAQALSTIANNLANSSTVGYKANSTRFSSLVTTSYTDNTAATGAGVTAVSRQNVTAQGTISSSDNDTDLAIDGNGFFVVSRKSAGTTTPTNPLYTRDGEFSVDDDGYLSLGSDYYLEGYAWYWDSATSTYTYSSGLSALQVTTGDEEWKKTSEVTLDANLPLSASTDSVSSGVASEMSTSVTVYDSAGSSHTVTLTFSADTSAEGEWTVSLSSADSSLSFSPSSYSVVFDSSSGTLTSVDGSTSDFSTDVTLSTGTSSQTVSFDFADLTEYDSGSSLTLTSLDQDGYPPSDYSGVTIDSDGTVTATYASGLTLTVGQIALANFSNANGLTVLSDGMYQVSTTSGSAQVGTSGENGTGTIDASALEASTTDTGTEFTKMIVAQQAYSAASQVISTAKTMYDDLLSAVR